MEFFVFNNPHNKLAEIKWVSLGLIYNMYICNPFDISLDSPNSISLLLSGYSSIYNDRWGRPIVAIQFCDFPRSLKSQPTKLHRPFTSKQFTLNYNWKDSPPMNF